jgi:hypothetical protein
LHQVYFLKELVWINSKKWSSLNHPCAAVASVVALRRTNSGYHKFYRNCNTVRRKANACADDDDYYRQHCPASVHPELSETMPGFVCEAAKPAVIRKL